MTSKKSSLIAESWACLRRVDIYSRDGDTRRATVAVAVSRGDILHGHQSLLSSADLTVPRAARRWRSDPSCLMYFRLPALQHTDTPTCSAHLPVESCALLVSCLYTPETNRTMAAWVTSCPHGSPCSLSSLHCKHLPDILITSPVSYGAIITRA